MAKKVEGLSLADRRQLLFKTCHSKKDLHRWIRVYLGLDIPECIIDPSSTASPMDIIYEVYERALKNDDENYSRVLVYASRDSYKTLSAAILEVLMLVHLDRSVAHMAAIEPQAAKCSSYVRKFLMRSILRDYVVGDNKREIFFVRYENDVGENITQKQYESLSPEDQEKYKEHETYVKVLVSTLQSTNSEHTNFMCVDELDVITNPRAYAEAQLIPAARDGKLPITLLTSTRKSYGLVQKEIDNAADTGLKIHHFNLIDVTERCPESRHKPELPRLPIYRSDDTLKAISEKAYEDLIPEKKSTYVKDEGFDGCLNNCRLFAMCQGRLATKQTSRSSLLKPIPDTINKFRSVDLDMAKAQLLCWKPSKIGLIYSRIDPTVHKISASAMAKMITGDDYPPHFSKTDLVALFRQRESAFYGGMDFGYSHNFAVVIGAKDGNRMFVIEAFQAAELDLGQKVSTCDSSIKKYSPSIYPDTAYPSDIKTFKKNGYSMRDWKKGPGSVKDGIGIMQTKLWPVIGEPELYFLEGDPGVELLFKQLAQYHWKLDAVGDPTDEPDDKDDDGPDGTRYMVMNVFASKGKITVTHDIPLPPSVATIQQQQYTEDNFIAKKVAELTGMTYESNAASNGQEQKKSGKGRFVFSIE